MSQLLDAVGRVHNWNPTVQRLLGDQFDLGAHVFHSSQARRVNQLVTTMATPIRTNNKGMVTGNEPLGEGPQAECSFERRDDSVRLTVRPLNITLDVEPVLIVDGLEADEVARLISAFDVESETWIS